MRIQFVRVELQDVLWLAKPLIMWHTVVKYGHCVNILSAFNAVLSDCAVSLYKSHRYCLLKPFNASPANHLICLLKYLTK